MKRITLILEAVLFIASILFSTSCRTFQRTIDVQSVVPFAADNYPLVEKWRAPLAEKIISTPATNGRLIAIWTTKGLQLIDGRSGEIQWSYRVDVEGQPIPPTVLDDLVIAPYHEVVNFFSAHTGEQLGQLRTPTNWSLDAKSMTTDDDHLYVVWGSVRLAAYSLATREVVWLANVADSISKQIVKIGVCQFPCLTIRPQFLKVFYTFLAQNRGSFWLLKPWQVIVFGKVVLIVIFSRHR